MNTTKVYTTTFLLWYPSFLRGCISSAVCGEEGGDTAGFTPRASQRSRAV